VAVVKLNAADRAHAGHRLGSVVLCVLAFLATGTSCRTRDGTHTAAVEAAKAAARADHQEWLKNTELESALVRPVQACGTKTPEGARRRFTAYLNLLRSGAVSQILVDPETPFALCLGDELKAARFTGVPRDGVWLEVGMLMDKTPPELPKQ